MTSGDVVAAIREQNVQVTGGTLGQQPAPTDNAFQLVVTTQGRFEDPRQFRQVIVRATSPFEACPISRCSGEMRIGRLVAGM